MNFNQDSAGEIIELAEILSKTTISGDAAEKRDDERQPRKIFSKTSMLIAILGSLSVMILMEIVTAIYKNLSEGNFGC